MVCLHEGTQDWSSRDPDICITLASAAEPQALAFRYLRGDFLFPLGIVKSPSGALDLGVKMLNSSGKCCCLVQKQGLVAT